MSDLSASDAAELFTSQMGGAKRKRRTKRKSTGKRKARRTKRKSTGKRKSRKGRKSRKTRRTKRKSSGRKRKYRRKMSRATARRKFVKYYSRKGRRKMMADLSHSKKKRVRSKSKRSRTYHPGHDDMVGVDDGTKTAKKAIMKMMKRKSLKSRKSRKGKRTTRRKKGKIPPHLRPWMKHLAAYRAKHPSQSLAKAMKGAKRTYKKKSRK